MPQNLTNTLLVCSDRSGRRTRPHLDYRHRHHRHRRRRRIRISSGRAGSTVINNLEVFKLAQLRANLIK